MQKARCHPLKGSNFFVRITFQVLFHPPSGVLFTFPSRYLSAIELCTCLALDGGPPRFRPDFTCPTLLRILATYRTHFVYGAITLYGRPFQAVRLCVRSRCRKSYNPACKHAVWAVPRSLATTRGISVLISRPQVLRCFSSLGDPLRPATNLPKEN